MYNALLQTKSENEHTYTVQSITAWVSIIAVTMINAEDQMFHPKTKPINMAVIQPFMT